MKLRVLSTIVGVMVGVASLVAVFNFSATARREILRDIEGLAPNLIFLRNTIPPSTPPPNTPPMSSADAASILSEIPEATACTPILQERVFQRLVAGDTRLSRLQVLGVWADFPSVLAMTLSQGRFFSPLEQIEARRVCVLSAEAARDHFPHGLEIGDPMRLFNAEFRIVGVVSDVEPCPFFRIQGGVLIPYETMLHMIEAPDAAQLIGIRLSPGAHPAPALARIESVLMRNRQEPFFESWQQNAYIETQKRVVRTIEWLLSSIAFLTLLTACIGCMNILVVSVNERTREIGLRMAVGASQARILFMFLMEGFRIMAAGGALGIVGGYFLTIHILRPLPNLITGYKGWTFTFSGESVWKAMVVLTISAFLACLLPAWRAARLDPSRALRRE